MKAGRLDRRITIQRATETQDSTGQEVPTWADLVTVSAGVTPLRGRETFAAAQTNASADTRFRIRWRSGITPKDRISYGGLIYDIEYIAEIGRREGLDILAKARVE